MRLKIAALSILSLLAMASYAQQVTPGDSGQYCAGFDSTGRLNAFYSTRTNPLEQRRGSVPISDSQWQEELNNPGSYMVVTHAEVVPAIATVPDRCNT